MTAAVYKDDYAAAGCDQLIPDFQKPLIMALASSWLKEAQAVEDVLLQLYTALFVDEAEGDALEQLGALVGQPRENRLDPVYRAWIKARIRVNRSAATVNDSLQIISLVDPNAVATLDEYPPASYAVTVSGLSTLTDTELLSLLRLVKPAAVRLMVAASSADPDALFTLGDADQTDANGNDLQPDSGTGFGDANNPAIGGELISAAG